MDITKKDFDYIVKAIKEEIEKTNTNKPKQSTVENLEGKAITKDTTEATFTGNTKEVGIGLAPAFGKYMSQTIAGLTHRDVLREIMAGIEEEGMIPRMIRVLRTSDVSFIGNDVAKIVGSGIAIGIQSKGTTVIHQRDLYPLTNLELFPQAPFITLEMYRNIGKNAAKYAKGEKVLPVKVKNEISARPKYQVKAALMHTKETEYVINREKPVDVSVIGR